jgi:hypothetical protein
MRYLLLVIPLILISYSSLAERPKSASVALEAPLSIDTAGLTLRQRKIIIDHEIYGKSEVKSFKKTNQTLGPLLSGEAKYQSLSFQMSGIHKRSCRYALSKISLYEKYKDYMSFVKSSSYDDRRSRIYLKLSHVLLPIDMVLYFILPRIKEAGVYKFLFDQGFLKGLKGRIHVSPYEKECFFFITANWEGPDTGFSDSLFEFFSKGISVLTIENLFRVSGGN